MGLFIALEQTVTVNVGASTVCSLDTQLKPLQVKGYKDALQMCMVTVISFCR